MIKIDRIESRLIPDSRHEDTIEVTLSSETHRVKASVPSGKSKGTFEAVSVSPKKAQDIISTLTEKITKEEFGCLEEFDKFLLAIDGSKDKSNLGANVTLALSIAFIRILASVENRPVHQVLSDIAGTHPNKFPLLFLNLINGGLHVNQDLHPLPFQEYLIVPQTGSPKEALNTAFSFIENLKNIVSKYQKDLIQGDEGGFVVSGNDPELGLQILKEALAENNNDIKFGLDVAATNIKEFEPQQLMDKYEEFLNNYPLMSIEDPFAEDDWDSWKIFYQKMDNKIWVIGDDLTVTNTERIKKAGETKAANAVIIKPNQIGTVSETIEAVKLAKSLGWKTIVSHRSGETEDDFIADLAYGVSADGLKAGSPLQKQRLVKYERLIEIENSH